MIKDFVVTYNVSRLVKQLIFPNKCILCGKLIEDKYLCLRCTDKIVVYHQCPRCGSLELPCQECSKLPDDIDAVKGLLQYKGGVPKSIARWKYSGVRKFSKGYANLMAEHFDKEVFNNIDALIPVPVHKKRLTTRGFNQACDLAQELSNLVGVPMVDMLERTKNTTELYRLSAAERKENTKDAIRVNPNFTDIQSSCIRRVAIVDDIYTTGSTVRECINALKKKGYDIELVYVFVICRA
ncbi:MAG: hypothetical protein BEN18_00335 [Epulopiscium sp. Nuni2H_MBin001]|nr:MAG: hypothetical protein BEN18_00335 [Epulopiscium sp. Nuni2H_MBin001]